MNKPKSRIKITSNHTLKGLVIEGECENFTLFDRIIKTTLKRDNTLGKVVLIEGDKEEELVPPLGLEYDKEWLLTIAREYKVTYTVIEEQYGPTHLIESSFGCYATLEVIKMGPTGNDIAICIGKIGEVGTASAIFTRLHKTLIRITHDNKKGFYGDDRMLSSVESIMAYLAIQYIEQYLQDK